MIPTPNSPRSARRRPRWPLAALLLAPLAALPTSAAATPLSGAPPAASAKAEVKLPVETTKLDNGLTLLMSRDTSLPVVAVEVRYLVGSSSEEPGKSGFAHLFEHLMFQGSKHFDQEYFAPFEPIGGVINGTTNPDRTNYFQRVPSQYLELALWMESDRMTNLLPALTQEKLDNQRDVVKNERRQNYENRPYGMFWFYVAEAIYPPGHPYRHLTIGSHADLTRASMSDVQRFFTRYYTPANAVVTLVGDFEPKQAKALVQRYFGGGKAGQRAATPKATPAKLSGVKHLKYTDAVAQPRVHLVWPTPALYATGDAALDVVASVLTDGKSSRLYKPLVFDQKIAKDVSAYQASSQLGSVFVVQATAAEGKSVEELTKALTLALAKAFETPPTKDEFERALNSWKKSFFHRVEDVLSRAQLLSTYYHLAGRADYLKEDLARYTRLTPADLHGTSQFIDLDNYVRIDITPGAKPQISDTMGGG